MQQSTVISCCQPEWPVWKPYRWQHSQLLHRSGADDSRVATGRRMGGDLGDAAGFPSWPHAAISSSPLLSRTVHTLPAWITMERNAITYSQDNCATITLPACLDSSTYVVRQVHRPRCAAGRMAGEQHAGDAERQQEYPSVMQVRWGQQQRRMAHCSTLT